MFRRVSPLSAALLACLLATAGCGALTPGWLSLPLAENPSEGRGQTAGQSEVEPSPPAATGPALPEPAKLDAKAMSEYVGELSKGVQFAQSRQYDDARATFRKLIEKWPGEYHAYHQLGQLCDRQKHYAEAQDCYQRAILLAGGREPTIFNDLGYSLFLQGHLAKAESALRKAVALRPGEAKFHNNLGLVLGHQQRYDEAWKEFRAAGGEADAFYNLAFIKASRKDFQGAKNCFRRALEVDPAHEGARRALRAFDMADTDPDSLALLESSTSDGTEWVPYVENAANDPTPPTAAPVRPHSPGSSKPDRAPAGGSPTN